MSNTKTSVQSLTALDDKQSETIAGGRRLRLHSIHCISSGADVGTPDDVSIRFNGKQVWTRTMRAGERVALKGLAFTFRWPGHPARAVVTLWDNDFGETRDDYIGGRFLDGVTRGLAKTTFQGAGSKYILTYSTGIR